MDGARSGLEQGSLLVGDVRVLEDLGLVAKGRRGGKGDVISDGRRDAGFAAGVCLNTY